MPPHELRQIASLDDLVGYWQFNGAAGRHLAVVDRDEAGKRLRVFTLLEDRWRRVRELPLSEPWAKALDGRLVGDTVVLCVEVNDYHAVRLLAEEYGHLVREDSADAFAPRADLDLAPDEQQRVEVPVSHLWNAATPLALSAWLFSPRLVRGDVREALVIASTADGQVALLGREGGGAVLRAPQIRRALEPQAVRVGEALIVAFQRPAQDDVYPFWLAPRHGKFVTGDLVVSDGTQPELNLSAVLGIGPVVRFALAPGWQGGVWLLALIDAPVGTDVVALERAHGTWTVRARQSLDRELRDLSVEAGPGEGEWHIVYAAATPEGSTLEYQAWRIAR